MQPLYAYRGYGLDTEYALLTGVFAPWKARKYEATCRNSNAYTGKGTKETMLKHLRNRSRYSCYCGINGTWLAKAANHGNVKAVCVFWGNIELASDGLRAEYARIEEIILPRDILDQRHREKLTNAEYNKLLIGLALRYRGARIIVGPRAFPSLKPNFDSLSAQEEVPYGERVIRTRETVNSGGGWTRADLVRQLCNRKGIGDDSSWCGGVWLDYDIKIYNKVTAIEKTGTGDPTIIAAINKLLFS